jgi:hypothetical protein
MNTLTIKSQLLINTYTGDNETISLKQGIYDVVVEQEDLTLIIQSERANLERVPSSSWKYLGDPDYASVGSDFHFVVIQDEKSNSPKLDQEWVEDNIVNFYANNESFIFEIPCGNGGGLSIFTLTDNNNNIIGAKLNGLHSDDM